MDLDSELKGLKKFKAESEEAIAFYHGMKLAGFNPAVLQPAATDTSITDRLATLEADKGTSQNALDGVADILVDIQKRLTALEGAKPADPVVLPDGLTEMLAWFQTNKDGLDILLSLDGDPDTATTTDTGTTDTGAAGTATPVAGSVTGATNVTTGTAAVPGDGTAPTAALDADAPGTVAG